MRAALPVLLTLALTACAPAAPSGPPVEIQPSQAEHLLQFSSDLSRKRVALEGYVFFDNGRNGEAIAMLPELRSGPAGAGETLIRFDIDYGPGPNQLDLHELSREKPPGFPGAPETITFDLSKATWQDGAGKTHPLSEKVRLVGRVEYVRLGNAGLLSDEDARSPTGRRFKPRLVDVELSPTAR